MAAAPLTKSIDLLLVDDEPDFLEPACRYFQRHGYRVVATADADQALDVQSKQYFHVAVIDQNMPGMNGLDLLRRLLKNDPDLKVIVLTGGGSIGSAVEAMKRGAVDYLAKPFGLDELDALMRKLTKSISLERENLSLKRQLDLLTQQRTMIGNSNGIQEVRRLIDRIATSDKPVLLQGESGTGKELVARAIHAQSPLSDRSLVVINCAALPETLLESELFGFEKGAFTGAVEGKPGLFEIADGGTLFIDEFGELAGSLQAKLLRVMEDGSMRRLGATKERKVKVRLIAATNRNLKAEVEAGRFREDLYYRVNILSINIPSLRDRMDDVPLLIEHFLGHEWRLDDKVRDVLCSYDWPGNVRQLANALERAKVLSDDNRILLENLPSELTCTRTQRPRPVLGSPIPLHSISALHVTDALRRNKGNKSKTAKELGIARRSLYRLLSTLESVEP
jgi:DNA-binding NtrC family response regulator